MSRTLNGRVGGATCGKLLAFEGPGPMVLLALVIMLFQSGARGDDDRPGLFFREDWKESPPATPITQDHVANPNLVLKLYGPGKDGIKKSHHDTPKDDPFYVWSGTCPANWAVALFHRNSFVDLTGLAKIRWRSKQAGFRQLRLIVKLADGTWLVSAQADEASRDWREREFNVSDLQWRRLDIDKILEGAAGRQAGPREG